MPLSFIVLVPLFGISGMAATICLATGRGALMDKAMDGRGEIWKSFVYNWLLVLWQNKDNLQIISVSLDTNITHTALDECRYYYKLPSTSRHCSKLSLLLCSWVN